MQRLIKQIREHLGLSQIKMAEELGVQFATINRWENGHSKPTRLAEEKLFSLCKESNVPVFEMIIENIKYETSLISLEPERILLYHGSKSGLTGNIAPISRNMCDFGRGFYMGTNPEQPLTLICDFEKSKFYIVSINTKELNKIEIAEDLDWAMTVAFNRGKMGRIKGTVFYSVYESKLKNRDLAIGSIADDKMFYVIDAFFDERITDNALVSSLSALKLGKQYVALTKKACNEIRIEKEIELSYFEKKVLRETSKRNRQKGIDIANEIFKSHRRDGKFFDEILDEALKEKTK